METRLLFITSLLIASQLTTWGQIPARDVALLAVECEAVNGVCQTQHLVRLRFRHGELISRDLISTTDTNRIRYDLGRNRIYRNRYVITNWADVVDVQNKVVLNQSIGEYVGSDGDRVIQHVNRVNVEGYFYFDLKTKSYRRLHRAGKWALPGLLSPDGTKSAERGAGNIWLYRLNQHRKLLGSDFLVEGDPGSSMDRWPPVFWLDNEHILTQRHNGKLVILQLDGTVAPLVDIPINEPAFSEPRFYRDGEGKLVYECSGKSFEIDVARRRFSPYEWLAFSFQFDAENDRNPSYGHIIRYQGREIGRIWGDVWSAPAIEGYLAIEYGELGSNLGYPKGIKVWASENRKWTTIDLKWLETVVGWIEEKE